MMDPRRATKIVKRIEKDGRVGTREIHLMPVALQYLHRAKTEALRAQRTPPSEKERERILAVIRQLPKEIQGIAAGELMVGTYPGAATQHNCFCALLFATMALEARLNEITWEHIPAEQHEQIFAKKRPQGRSQPVWKWVCLVAYLRGETPSHDYVPMFDSAEEMFFARNALVHYDLEATGAVQERFLPEGIDAVPFVWPPGYEPVYERPSVVERVVEPAFAAMAFHTARMVLGYAGALVREFKAERGQEPQDAGVHTGDQATTNEEPE